MEKNINKTFITWSHIIMSCKTQTTIVSSGRWRWRRCLSEDYLFSGISSISV